jgi:hypothetical protein
MLGDLFVCFFLIRDFTSPAAMTTFFHHFLSILGASGGIYIGRYIGTISSVTQITEITTPLVNNRWILHFHGKTESLLYLVNGALMTLGFFIFRFLFLVYVVIFVLFGAYSNFDLSQDPSAIQIAVKVLLFLY